MPHEGYANPVRNDGPKFHSNVPISKLTDCVTRAIDASNVSSAPLVARNRGWGNAQNSTDPYQAQTGLRGSRHANASAAPRVRNSDSLNPMARPMPGSATPTCPIPQHARCLDP